MGGGRGSIGSGWKLSEDGDGWRNNMGESGRLLLLLLLLKRKCSFRELGDVEYEDVLGKEKQKSWFICVVGGVRSKERERVCVCLKFERERD